MNKLTLIEQKELSGKKRAQALTNLKIIAPSGTFSKKDLEEWLKPSERSVKIKRMQSKLARAFMSI